ncbi:MAG: AAA family ATPase [Myxococcota bacterium]
MMRLRRLEIHRFRGVAPGTVLEFTDGINVILGQNGTGKTTLLELISMIVRSNFSSLRGETFSVGFTLEVDDTTASVTLEARASTEPVDEKQLLARMRDPSARPESDSASWSYAVEVQDQRIAVNSDGITVPERRIARINLDLFKPGFLDRLNAAFDLRAVDFPFTMPRFDEALGGFQGVVRPDRPTLLLFGSDGEVVGLLPPGALRRLSERSDPATPEELRLTRGDDPLFERVCSVLGVADLSVHPRYDRTDEHVTEYRGFDLIVTLDEADPPTRVQHDYLSFGQKRMLAFLWTLSTIPDGVVIADELVNGLHHQWIEACIAEIGDRQAFLATQNPLLLDFLTFDTVDDVRTTFVLCATTPRPDGRRGWSWRNLSADEASSFFRAHQVGIQHVNEILRTKGLW